MLKSGHDLPLPVILPIVFYHGVFQWRIATDFGSLFDPQSKLVGHVANFRYLLTDLSEYTDEELRGGVSLRAALLAMKYIYRRELPERISVILNLLNDLPKQSSGLTYLHTVLRYFSQASNRLSRNEEP